MRRVLCGGVILACAGFSFVKHSKEAPFGTDRPSPYALKGTIYHLPIDTQRLPNLERLKPQGVIYTTSLNVTARSFTEGFPGVTRRIEWFAIDYQGTFWVEEAGKYKFSLASDDGSRLFIDDRQIIDNDGVHAEETAFGAAMLAAGLHRIRVTYFQGPGYSIALVLEMAAPHKKYRPFDTEDYRPPAAPDPDRPLLKH